MQSGLFKFMEFCVQIGVMFYLVCAQLAKVLIMYHHELQRLDMNVENSKIVERVFSVGYVLVLGIFAIINGFKQAAEIIYDVVSFIV